LGVNGWGAPQVMGTGNGGGLNELATRRSVMGNYSRGTMERFFETRSNRAIQFDDD